MAATYGRRFHPRTTCAIEEPFCHTKWCLVIGRASACSAKGRGARKSRTPVVRGVTGLPWEHDAAIEPSFNEIRWHAGCAL